MLCNTTLWLLRPRIRNSLELNLMKEEKPTSNQISKLNKIKK